MEYSNQKWSKSFDQLYKVDQIIAKDQNWSLVIVSETKVKEELKKKKKKEEKNRYTVKIYPKAVFKKNQELVQQIIREKKYLEEVMSPYFPILYKCILSKTFAYCMTQFYIGEHLEHYVKNETVSKSTLKMLLGQIATGIGQLHQCGIAYNNVNLKGIFITDRGFVLFNDLGMCTRIREGFMDEDQDEETKEKELKPTGGSSDQDWLSFGKLIYEIKEGKKWSAESVPEYKSKELTQLMQGLLQKNPEKRLGTC